MYCRFLNFSSGSETAKRALREKDDGILIDAQKQWKSTKKDNDNLKKQKNIDSMCSIIPTCGSVPAIARENTMKL